MTTTTTNWETVRHEGEVYKVLNDHAGTLTVTEWREQLEEYAEHICDKTGLELASWRLLLTSSPLDACSRKWGTSNCNQRE